MNNSSNGGECRRRASQTAAGVLAAVLLSGTASVAVAADRVVIALDPPTVETNLFWHGIGERLPSMYSLVGQDEITGDYDNSELAAEWWANDEFTEWTFRLHEDAEFHFDWGPVTAHDVVLSHDLHTGDDSTLTGAPQLKADEVVAIDDHTVEFRFEQPRVDYAFMHAGRGSMYVYSKAQYDEEGLEGYDRLPAGTGPYQYKERRPGVSVIFERVEGDHWSGIEPDFQELEMRWVAEPATKLALLLAGEAHIVDLPRELQRDAVEQGFEIISSHNPAIQITFMFNGLYMQSGDPAHRPELPWADVRVREAMNRALDRDVMLEVLYDGRATPLVRYNMHEPHEGYVPELVERFEEMYGYDPERAKELLAEAGYPDAFPDPVIPLVSVPWAGNPDFQPMAELIQVFFEEIGLQTVIREMDTTSLGAMGRAREAYLLNPIRNAPIRPSEVGLRNTFTNQGSVYHGYEDDKINELIDQLRATIDPDEREALIQEAFTYAFEQYTDMPIAAIDAEAVVNPEVVAEWTFPGVTSVGFSHWHLIKAAN